MYALTDHPRSRGVYTHQPNREEREMGSSPLARGLRLYAPHTRDRAGIIPARAGFTRRPRIILRGIIGSSPLARGLPALGDSL